MQISGIFPPPRLTDRSCGKFFSFSSKTSHTEPPPSAILHKEKSTFHILLRHLNNTRLEKRWKLFRPLLHVTNGNERKKKKLANSCGRNKKFSYRWKNCFPGSYRCRRRRDWISLIWILYQFAVSRGRSFLLLWKFNFLRQVRWQRWVYDRFFFILPSRPPSRDHLE